MGDYVEARVGDRLYRVYGLEDLAAEIEDAASEMWGLLADRVAAANDALEEWSGPHANAFVDRANEEVLASIVDLRWALLLAADRCRSFPDEGYVSVYAYGEEFQSAQVEKGRDLYGIVGAETDMLRDFVDQGTTDDPRLSTLAARATVDDLTAEAADRLSPSELEERGYPDSVLDTEVVWGDFESVPVSEVFDLPDLAGDAATVQTLSGDLGVWVGAVASGIDEADEPRLDLLLEHPELAGFLDDDGATEGAMTGEVALTVVDEHFDTLDTAAGIGDSDGEVGRQDLEAAAEDGDYPDELRAAAGYLLDNPVFLSQLSLVNEPVAYEADPEAHRFTREDISTFQELNSALRTIAVDFDQLDTARQDGDGDDADPDGEVSHNDLLAVAEGEGYSDELREAAQFMLDNPLLAQRALYYEDANAARDASTEPGFDLDEAVTESGFSYEGVVALAVDQQAFASDPEAAREFVEGLPTADHEGDGGLSIYLSSTEGVTALANAALLDAPTLTDQHSVIAHLPETTDGVRNELITGFYDLLGGRSEAIFAGPELAGLPEEEGHPGASWLQFASWASYGVRNVIDGDFRVFGTTGSTQRQAAADGNQWIFEDVGGKFAAFVELHEQYPNPTPDQVQRFFADTFEEGDGTTQNAFAAYTAAMNETDPIRRQELMFQGNAFIGLQEQAGVHVYLTRISPNYLLDSPLTRYADLRVGRDILHLDSDLEERPGANNHLPRGSLLDLDISGLAAEDFSTSSLDFQVGGERSADGVYLGEHEGIEAMQPDFTQSMEEIFEEGSRVEVSVMVPGDPAPHHERLDDPPDAEGLQGSGADGWQSWTQRMNFITKFFAEFHTDPELYNTDIEDIALDRVEWLDEGARPGG